METNAQRPSQSEEVADWPFVAVVFFCFPSLKSFSLTQAEQINTRRRRSENISNIRGKLVCCSLDGANWLCLIWFGCELTPTRHPSLHFFSQSPADGKLNGESPPPAKRSRRADSGKKRVTFNPTVQEKTLQPVHEPPKSVKLKEAADIVVRYLDPFYTQGKFATKVRNARRGELMRLRRGELTCSPPFPRRSCLSPSPATCRTSWRRDGVGGQPRVG